MAKKIDGRIPKLILTFLDGHKRRHLVMDASFHVGFSIGITGCCIIHTSAVQSSIGHLFRRTASSANHIQ